jgi:hypothetical protein
VGEVADATEVAEPPAVVAEESEPEVAVDPAPVRRRRFARWFAFLRAPEPEAPQAELVEPVELVEPEPPLEPEPAPAAEPEPEPEPELAAEQPPAEAITEPPPTEAALTAALDSLGQAHHRPYSRA